MESEIEIKRASLKLTFCILLTLGFFQALTFDDTSAQATMLEAPVVDPFLVSEGNSTVATISISPTINVADPGQFFTINIDVAGIDAAKPLNWWEIKLQYNHEVLYTNASLWSEGPFLFEAALSEGYSTYFAKYLGIYYIQLGCMIMGPVGASGNGTLATVKFLVIDSGKSDLHLYDTKLYDPNYPSPGSAITHTSTDATFYTRVPVAKFTYWPTNPYVGETITFSASDSYDPDGGTITNYAWDFDDGNFNSTSDPITHHAYTAPGTYSVNLTVTDNAGLTDSTIAIVEVYPPPPVPFASRGTYLKIGIDTAAHYGDYDIGYGFQYPHGFEHAAVGWWGEGFTFGYMTDPGVFVATSYEDWPGVTNMVLVSATVIADTLDYAVYETVWRTADGRVELTHKFQFYKDTKFVILTATIKNIGGDSLSGVRYRRVWDIDVDSIFDNEFNVDLSRHMLFASEIHYAALAAYSGNPPSEWDVDAWDDREVYLPGPRVHTGPFPAYGDYIVRLEWVYSSIAPGETVDIVMYHMGGDSKADLDDSYDLAETKITPREHELAVTLEIPTFVKLGDSVLLNATVYNRGLSNETDVWLHLMINGENVHSENVSELFASSFYRFSYLWTPLGEGTYNVTAYTPPVPDEAITANNRATRFVTVARPLIQPIEGQWANYTLTFTDKATGRTMVLFLNATYSKYISPHLMNVTIWMKDVSTGSTMTGWLTLNVMTRQVESGIWAGMWYPLWIETNVKVGSTVNILNTVGKVTASRFVEIGDFVVDCWELQVTYYDIHYTFWFDEVNGLVTAIEGSSPYFMESWQLTATNVPLVYLPRLRIRITPESGPVGTEVTVTGINAKPNGTVEIYWDNISLGTAPTDENGDFAFTFTVSPSTRGPHTITAIDLTTTISDRTVFTVLPSISVTPISGPLGVRVQVTGLGFGANEHVVLSFEDMRIAEVSADDSGSFTAKFNIPLSQSGPYLIKAWYGDNHVQTTFTVTDVSPLDVNIDVGAIYFKEETVEFYVQTAFNGKPIDVTFMKATLYMADGTIKTLTYQRIATGLYRVQYTIRGRGSMTGTYTLVVEAGCITSTVNAHGTSIKTFLVKPTWEREAPKIAAFTIASIGLVSAMILLWRREKKKFL